MRHTTNESAAYILKGIDRRLWARAQAKAQGNDPPMSMRWVLIKLLERWVGPDPDPTAAPEPAPKPKRAPKVAAVAVAEPVSEAPALEDVF